MGLKKGKKEEEMLTGFETLTLRRKINPFANLTNYHQYGKCNI